MDKEAIGGVVGHGAEGGGFFGRGHAEQDEVEAVVAFFAPPEVFAELAFVIEGGVVSGFLVAAAVGFWAAALLSGRDEPRRSGAILLMSLGMCAIMIDAGLKQTGAGIEVRQVHTGAVVLLGLAATLQHRWTGGRSWVHAPRWLRRALSWPFVMVLAEMFSGIMGALAAPGAWDGEPIGSVIFQIVFVFAVSMPMIYAFFVVAPRRAIDPAEPAGTGTWALRYLWAIAAALVGERVIAPLAGGGG